MKQAAVNQITETNISSVGFICWYLASAALQLSKQQRCKRRLLRCWEFVLTWSFDFWTKINPKPTKQDTSTEDVEDREKTTLDPRHALAMGPCTLPRQPGKLPIQQLPLIDHHRRRPTDVASSHFGLLIDQTNFRLCLCASEFWWTMAAEGGKYASLPGIVSFLNFNLVPFLRRRSDLFSLFQDTQPDVYETTELGPPEKPGQVRLAWIPVRRRRWP